MSVVMWIDVATTSTPVLLTEQCIHSFLVHFRDRFDYRIRWVYHLDQYPLPGLEKNWEENLKMAVKLKSWFDDALIMASDTNQSYGMSVVRVMKEIQNPVFWIEDDKYWNNAVQPESLLEPSVLPDNHYQPRQIEPP